MKKITIVLALALAFISSDLMAQKEVIPKPKSWVGKEIGAQTLQLGLGLNDNLARNGASMNVPLVDVSYLYRITYKFDVGAYIGYANYSEVSSTHTWDYNYLAIGGRMMYELLTVRNLDFRIGLTLGYKLANENLSRGQSINAPNEDVSEVMWGVHLLNARYYFAENWAGYVDLGIGLRNLGLGIEYRLK